VTLLFDYVSAFGGGSGQATDFLLPRQQRIIPDAISYLRSLGIPIPDEGNRGGTLAVTFVGLGSPSGGAVTVRTTTEVGGGRAGLAYAGVTGSNRLSEPVYLCGLRQNPSDRSNVAFQNVGGVTDGNVTLRISVYSGDSTVAIDLPDEILSPGEFRQLTEILKPLGLSSGYAKVQRMAGTAPFYAYGVINDQNNSDGSFVAPTSASTAAPRRGFTIPVVVENSQFETEIILTNWSSAPKALRLDYVAESIDTNDKTSRYSITLNAGAQVIVPSLVQFLRSNGSPGVGLKGLTYSGALFVEAIDGDASEVFGSARTSSLGAGGRFGLFYSGVPFGQGSSSSTWLFGLQQNGESRTNLAIVNTGETDSSTDVFRVEIYDGTNGTFVTSAQFNVRARGWMQIGSIMANYAPNINQGYVRVTRTSGTNPFITYAVINDGATNLERTSDGAFVASSP